MITPLLGLRCLCPHGDSRWLEPDLRFGVADTLLRVGALKTKLCHTGAILFQGN